MEYFIDTVAATADSVGRKRRSAKTIMISFDEWNIWYLEAHEAKTDLREGWPTAPPLLEDVYTVTDAVVLGDLLMTLLSRADRVTSASLAQLVNVIAPIMTEPGGTAWRQTTFYPFSITSRLARGNVVRHTIEVDAYETAAHGSVALVHCVATHDPETGAIAVFLVNRDQDSPTTVDVDLGGLLATSLVEGVSLWDDDRTASNTKDDPIRVRPRPATAVVDGSHLIATLPPVSWNAFALEPPTRAGLTPLN
jgi:alpha-N-arabinofuranosidase